MFDQKKICGKKNVWRNFRKQAGTELGQAQLKLGLDFTLIFCRIGFSPLRLLELV